MAIDFPNSPTVGQTYAVGNRIWEWSGTAWDLQTATNDAIQETLIDAKGDLIVGSAADTASRLAKGADGKYLMVLTSEATGLKYTNPGEEVSTVLAMGSFI